MPLVVMPVHSVGLLRLNGSPVQLNGHGQHIVALGLISGTECKHRHLSMYLRCCLTHICAQSVNEIRSRYRQLVSHVLLDG